MIYMHGAMWRCIEHTSRRNNKKSEVLRAYCTQGLKKKAATIYDLFVIVWCVGSTICDELRDTHVVLENIGVAFACILESATFLVVVAE